ncbi:hypothetical protein YC2023_112994 [Brassica napus]
MVLQERYAILERFKALRTLKVGSTMLFRETRAPFCRVVGYIFGLDYVKKPLYIVRLESESDFQLPLGTRLPLIHDESVEYIDEEDLFKIFHDPAKTDVFDEEEEEEVNDCQSTTTKRRRMSTNEQEIINSNHYDGSSHRIIWTLFPIYQDSMMYNQQQLDQPNQMGFFPTLPPSLAPVTPMMYNQQLGFRSSQLTEPNLGTQVPAMLLRQPFGMRQQPFLNATAPMMYNPPQQFMRPEINQPNQMRIVPNPLPVQPPMMMYNQKYGSQIIEPNLGAQVSAMFLGQNNPNQSFSMRQQPFQSAAASVMYNQQSMRPEINQPNQMRIVPNPLPVQPPVMMYNQQYGSQVIEPNLGAQVSTMFVGQNNPNQPFGMRQQPSQSAAAPVMYNQQQQSMRPVTNQQNQMSSMRMFNAGQSSYRGRGGRRSRARGGLGRAGRD